MSIQAQDLRIGNWVKIRGEYNVQVTDLIGLEWFSYMPSQACDYKDTEPIPLTPELLQKAGFNHVDMMFGGPGNRMAYYRNDWCIVEHGGIITLFNDKEKMISVECKSLHQLQNFWYAITQTELNIQL